MKPLLSFPAMPRTRNQQGWITRENGRWYGYFRQYVLSVETGKEKAHYRMVVLGKCSETTKAEARKKLREEIERRLGSQQAVRPDPKTLLSTFVEMRYLPVKRPRWRPATQKYSEYEIAHYIVPRFGERSLEDLNDKVIVQNFLTELAGKYSDVVVRHVKAHLSGIIQEAVDQEFLDRNRIHGAVVPERPKKKKPTLSPEVQAAIIRNMLHPRDSALLCVGIFCALRTSEAFGLTWGCYHKDHFEIRNTAWEGKLYEGQTKTDESAAAVPIPVPVQKIIEAWKEQCKDTSADALMFPSAKAKTPLTPKNFFRNRVWPITDKMKLGRKLVRFQVFRRTVGTELQKHGSMKDAQAAMRHASIKTTADVYMQEIPESVRAALESRAKEILGVQ